ncbi:hypothetical protein HLK59_09660 [Streptomyces sp. S3(2020)]|uniref:hypothetical protein n=1 Tax=Streptomyces sp. S3(2020) TaxID=2732044 RepID=UPI001487BEFD|nr:hypothetical protein [Streptomyces sp. S3(2020)]NNN30627.1 hypothetical protein [Streptomyces sp. S3(2020)]
MARRKLAAALFAAAAIATSTIGINGTAAAHTDGTTGATGILSSEAARQPSLTADQMANAVAPKTARSASAAASLNCAYYYVCGMGANGNRFDYTTCGTTYTLPNLVGWGSLHNNQTPGTRAHFYDVNGAWMFSIDAPNKNDVYWTPVWYVIAC